MVGKNDKLGDMIKRNINEMGFAILQRKTMNGLESANFAHEGLDFFRITHISLFNDMMAHIIKVMDTNKQSATFWAIYDQYKVDIDSLWKQRGFFLIDIQLVASKLKLIRDKTNFHIDEKAVSKPKEVWTTADLTGAQLTATMDIVWATLLHVHRIHFGEEFEFSASKYTGEDAKKIMHAAQAAGII